MVVQALGGERCQRGAHLLHRLGLDLADALGRNAKLGGQFVQRGRIVAEPACLDDATAAFIQLPFAFIIFGLLPFPVLADCFHQILFPLFQ